MVRWKYITPVEDQGRGSSWFHVPEADRTAFDEEMRTWFEEGIIVRYDSEKHGEIKRFLPMLSVRQQKGISTKVRPVFDFREMNRDIQSHPAGATPLCADRLREWRKWGQKCAIIDLRKAYLQIHVDQDRWAHQAIRWRGETFLLIRLGFGLATAPKIMTAIVEEVIRADENVKAGVSSYIDDIYVDLSKVSAADVIEHFAKYGLEAKPPLQLGSGGQNVRVLGLSVSSDWKWGRDGLPTVVDQESLTRRQVHRVLGEWVGHFPVAGWLRVACGYVQRRTAEGNCGWDEAVGPEIMRIMGDIYRRLNDEGDPAKGTWQVNKDAPVTVWTDASSLALGVVIEIDHEIVEDAAWLRSKADTAHINRVELDAVIKGLNLAIKWGNREIAIMCDSVTVCG